MKKLVASALFFFSAASFASLTPMNLVVHQEILNDTQAVVNGSGSAMGHSGFNAFPWSAVTSLCPDHHPCMATIYVLNNTTGSRVKAGKIQFSPLTGVMTVVSNNNGYQLIVNGLAEATIEKVS